MRIAFVLSLAACGGGDPNVPDAALERDAAMIDAAVAVDAPSCLVANAVTATKAVGTEKVTADANPVKDGLFYEGFYTDDAKPDGFYMFLFSGSGPFTDGIAPMTIDIGALPDEQNGDTCSACLVLEGDVDVANHTETVDYMPRTGKLTITSLQDTFTATLTDATFRQVDMPDGGATPDDPSGCTASVANYTFSGTIVVQ